MKPQLQQRLLLAFAALMMALPAHPAYAAAPAGQTPAEAAPAGAPAVNQNAPPPRQATEQAEPEDEKDRYRISAVTRFTGRILHVSPKAAAIIFEVLNFVVLFGAIGWVLKKRLPLFFRSRSDKLQKQLVESRAATEDANRRLRAIEERLSKLDTEIIAMRQQAERDMAHEEERFRDALNAERDRIVTQAEQEIDSVSHAARRELRRYAAELAIDTAEKQLNVTPEIDQKLIDEFLASLEGK